MALKASGFGGVAKLHDLTAGGVACDLCGDEVDSEVTDAVALDCSFAQCDPQSSCYHTHCLEKFLKSLRCERNRKIGFPCPRGCGKGTRFKEPCRGKILKSHPVTIRSEANKKRRQAELEQLAQQTAARDKTSKKKDEEAKATAKAAAAKGKEKGKAAAKAPAIKALNVVNTTLTSAAPPKTQAQLQKEQLAAAAKTLKSQILARSGSTASTASSATATSKLAASASGRLSAAGSASGKKEVKTLDEYLAERSGASSAMLDRASSVASSVTGPPASAWGKSRASSASSLDADPLQQEPAAAAGLAPPAAAAALASDDALPPPAAAAGRPPRPPAPAPAPAVPAPAPAAVQPQGVWAQKPAVAVVASAAPPPPPPRAALPAAPTAAPAAAKGKAAASPPAPAAAAGAADDAKLSRTQRKNQKRAEKKAAAAAAAAAAGSPGASTPSPPESLPTSPVAAPSAHAAASAADAAPPADGALSFSDGDGQDLPPAFDDSFEHCMQVLVQYKLQHQVEQLQQLGFPAAASLAAVQQHGGNLEGALVALLEQATGVQDSMHGLGLAVSAAPAEVDLSEELALMQELQLRYSLPPGAVEMLVVEHQGDLDSLATSLVQQQQAMLAYSGSSSGAAQQPPQPAAPRQHLQQQHQRVTQQQVTPALPAEPPSTCSGGLFGTLGGGEPAAFSLDSWGASASQDSAGSSTAAASGGCYSAFGFGGFAEAALHAVHGGGGSAGQLLGADGGVGTPTSRGQPAALGAGIWGGPAPAPHSGSPAHGLSDSTPALLSLLGVSSAAAAAPVGASGYGLLGPFDPLQPGSSAHSPFDPHQPAGAGAGGLPFPGSGGSWQGGDALGSSGGCSGGGTTGVLHQPQPFLGLWGAAGLSSGKDQDLSLLVR